MSDMEQEARALNQADSEIKRAYSTYRSCGWTRSDFEERLSEILDEEDDG